MSGDILKYLKIHSALRQTIIWSTVLRLRNSGLGEEAMKEEKRLPPPRAVAMTDVQVLKDKAKSQSFRFHYQESGFE